MHVVKLLHKHFKLSVPSLHKYRLDRLLLAASSLLSNAKLTLTSLGRHMSGNARVKNKIKSVDRLMNNSHLSKERVELYKAMAAKVIGQLKKIDILVDWSPAGNHENHILRASLALKDRSITLYEEVHPEKKLGNYKVHKLFLNTLATIIPKHATPTVITDAGFRTEWFELVEKLDWDFEGRIFHNKMYYCLEGNVIWQPVNTLRASATRTPHYIGKVWLTKNRKFHCEIYSYLGPVKKKKLTKKRKRRKGNSNKSESRYRKLAKNPWLLVKSIKPGRKNAKKVVKRYTRRMKIEHEFRDTKDRKWGLGLNDTATRNAKRLEILLLIAAICILMLWLIGLAAELKEMHYHFQANTIKKYRVLSLVFLGLQVIEHSLNDITRNDLAGALEYAQNSENNFYR